MKFNESLVPNLSYFFIRKELNLPGLDGVDQRAALIGESDEVPRDRVQVGKTNFLILNISKLLLCKIRRK